MTSEDYLREAYLGELGGEATFRALVEVLPDRAADLSLLADVERVTANYLKPHLRAEVPEALVVERRKAGEQGVSALGVESWEGFLKIALPVVEKALARMKDAEAGAPEALLEVYETYSAHEQALADFMHQELEGNAGAHVLERYLERVAP